MGHVSKIVALAKRIARDILNENVIGIILFGSLARGNADELSDIDLALVVDGGELGLEEKVIEGIKVEVWRYDIKHFLHTFEDGKYRKRDNSWFTLSLWLGLLKYGMILEDPEGLLRKWKKQALEWRWRKEEILPLVRKAEGCLMVARNAYGQKKPFEGVIALRDCCYNLANAWIMARNGVPSVRPKDIYREVKCARFKKLFDKVQGLEGITRTQVKDLLDELKDLLDEVWKEPRGARTEYRNAVKSLARGELCVAVLSARYSAFYVGHRILRLERGEVPIRPYDAESHLRMLEILNKLKRGDFIKIYRRLHGAERIDLKYLDESIRLIHRALDNFPVSTS